MKLSAFFLLAVSAWAQAISTPGASTLNPNQVTVSTSYLYYNKMHYAGAWSSTSTYSSQDLVLYSGAAYISLGTGNLNNTPVSSATWWVVLPGTGGGSSVWGGISGTLSSQTDLQTALNAKQASLGYTPLNAASNLSDVASTSTTRTNLGLGTAALKGVTGTGSTLGAITGTPVSGHCVNFDANFNLTDSGAVCGSSSGAVWGSVTGTLSSQTDLQTALNAKAASNASTTVYGTACVLGSTCTPTLPNPSASTLGGIESITSLTHNWIAYINTSGVPVQSQPAFTDISGSVAAAQLPGPTGSTLGGIQSITSLTHNWIAYINTSGVPVQSQPAFTDMSGSATCAQLPALTGGATSSAGTCATTLANPSASTLGGIESITSLTHNWIAYINTSGVPIQSQPAFTDVSGSATCAQLPALTGGVTSSAGSCATVAANPGVTVTTGTSATLSTPYTYNQEATAATAVAYTLPTASAGAQYCVDNSYNGSAATTGALTVNASASGQFIIFTDGTLSATGGFVLSGGAARDGACFAGVDSTHWMFYPHSPAAGTWAKH